MFAKIIMSNDRKPTYFLPPWYPRKDRYNKKIRKYYVVYEEADEDLSEDEERHEHVSKEAFWVVLTPSSSA